MKRYLYLVPAAVALLTLSSTVALAATASSPRVTTSPSAAAATASPTATPIPLTQCAAYASQAAAQAAFNAHPILLHNLDANDNGIACESLPAPYSPALTAILTQGGPKAIASPSATPAAVLADPPAPPVTGRQR